MFDKEQAKVKLKELVNQFSQANLNKDYINHQNEEWIKHNYLEPLLYDVLGWSRGDIEKEARVLRGRADYILKIGNEEVLVIEAKKAGSSLGDEVGKQAVSYAYHRKIKIAIVTNFKEVRVYHALNNPKDVDKNLLKIDSNIPFRLPFDQFLDKFDILSLLSKESFEGKSIIKLLPSKLERASKPIDESILDDLLQFRDWLSKDLKKTRMHLAKEHIDEIVQILIDRLIFMRSVEDRGLEPKNFLLGLIDDVRLGRTDKNLWTSLKDTFKTFDKSYNSKLFAEGLLEKEGFFDEQTLVKILKGLYFGTKELQARYMFDEIPGDLLGNIYEQYLGTILQDTEKRVKLEGSSGKRKKMGIYYTPSYIVDYIVKNTVGEYIKDRSIDEILEVKIVDPACGSGSFLIRAFQEICNAIEERLKKGEKGKMASFQSYKDRLSFSQKISILTQCIHGVDLDEKAVELAQLNLLLKLLEDETPDSHKRLLPNLKENIKCGNSLIDDLKVAGDKAFKWEAQFKHVFNDGGFDVVIGNPPYVRMEKIPKTDRIYYKLNYKSAPKRFDLYSLFIEKAIGLLNNNGNFAFIIPNTLINNDDFEILRKEILDKCLIKRINLLGSGIFKEATVSTIIPFLKKEANSNIKNVNVIKFSFGNLSGYQNEIEVNQESLFDNEKYRFNPQVFKDQNIIEKCSLNSSTFEKELDYISGIQVWQNEGDRIKNPNLLTKKKYDDRYKKTILGQNIYKYFLRFDEDYVLYDKKLLERAREERYFIKTEKLLMRYIGTKITCAYDNEQYYAQKSVIILFPKNDSKLKIKYLLALINSRLIQYLYNKKVGTEPYPRINLSYLLSLPIKIPSEEQERLILDLATQMILLQKNYRKDKISGNEKERLEQQIKNIDYEIDQEVYKLYGLTKEEQKIIEEGLK